MKNILKNTHVIEIIADTLIQEKKLRKNIREDLISVGEIAYLECKKSEDSIKCITKKMLDFIKKEQEFEEVPSFLSQLAQYGDKYKVFLNAFNNMPKNIQALTIESFANNAEIDIKSLQIIRNEFVGNLREEDEELGNIASEALLKKQKEIEKVEKCRGRCKKVYK